MSLIPHVKKSQTLSQICSSALSSCGVVSTHSHCSYAVALKHLTTYQDYSGYGDTTLRQQVPTSFKERLFET